MVIGKGMIAKAFENYHNQQHFVIFASGVSDSTNTGKAAFEREQELLSNTLKTNKEKLLVYYSTCSITDPSMQDSAYVKHKLQMEELIILSHTQYIIFRLTNPIGSTNNIHTILNYFIKNIIEHHSFSVWKNASRNIIDIDDMYLLCNEILQQKLFTNSIVNIANPANYPVSFIVETLEKHFNVIGNYTMIDKAGAPVIDTSAVAPLFTKFNINFDEHYLPNLLKKYFPV